MLETEPIELVGTLNVGVVAKGTKNYDELINKPVVNGVELEGTLESADLGLQPAGSYVENETDPVFSASASAGITSQDITNWNNKSDFSGNYNDLTNKPDLSVYSLITETGNKIELEINSLTYVLTAKLYDKNNTLLSTSSGIDLPLETMVVSGSYDSTNKKIILTLQNGTTIDVPVGDLISGLQTEITSNNKLSSDLVDDTDKTNKFVTASEKTTWGNKYDKPSGGIPSTDLSSAVQTSLGKADTAIQDISGKQDIIQYSTMPTASADNLGKIIQYTGATDTYINGYYYKCVSDGATEPTYSWATISVQDLSNYQPLLVSGTNIKTINNTSILGNGDISIQSSKGIYYVTTTGDNASPTTSQLTTILNEMINKGETYVQPFVIVNYSTNNYVPSWRSTGFYIPAGYTSESATLKSNNSFIIRGFAIEGAFVNNQNLDIKIAGSASITKTYNSSTNQVTVSNISNGIGRTILTQDNAGNYALLKSNTASFTPTGDYNPATKKYVDDMVGNISTILETLVTVSGGE